MHSIGLIKTSELPYPHAFHLTHQNIRTATFTYSHALIHRQCISNKHSFTCMALITAQFLQSFFRHAQSHARISHSREKLKSKKTPTLVFAFALTLLQHCSMTFLHFHHSHWLNKYRVCRQPNMQIVQCCLLLLWEMVWFRTLGLNTTQNWKMCILGTNLADFFLILATLSDGGSMAQDSSWLQATKTRNC